MADELTELREENAKLKREVEQYKIDESSLLRKLKRTQTLLGQRDKMIGDLNTQVEALRKQLPKHARRVTPSAHQLKGMTSSIVANEMGALGGDDSEDEEEEDSKHKVSGVVEQPCGGLMDVEPKIESTEGGRIKRASLRPLDHKFSERSTIEETIARGILHERPDSRVDQSVSEKSRALAKRRASAQVDRMLETRATREELRGKGIYKDEADIIEDTKRKRRTSRILEATLNPRSRATIEDLSEHGIHLAALFDGGADGADLDPFAIDDTAASGRRARGSGEFVVEGDADSDDSEAKTREEAAAGGLLAAGHRGSEDEKTQELLQWTGLDLDLDNMSFKELRRRVGGEFRQRSTVHELIERGILYASPALRPRMAKLRRDKELREYKDELSLFFQRRPKDSELIKDKLVDMRILPKESKKTRELHKRRLSRQLEESLIARPTPEEVNQNMGYQVVDLSQLLFSFVVGSALAEARAAQLDPENPVSATDSYAMSQRAIDMGGGGGLGMAMAMSMMGAGGGLGSQRRGSGASDISDLAAGTDAEETRMVLDSLRTRVAELESLVTMKEGELDAVRERQRKQMAEMSSMELRNEQMVTDMHAKASAAHRDAKVDVEAVMRELDLANLEVHKQKVYMEALQSAMDRRGVGLPSQEELNRQVKERLARFCVERPSIEELRDKNILPSERTMDVHRISQVLKTGLTFSRQRVEELKSRGIYKDADSRGTSEDSDEEDIDGVRLTSQIDELHAQIKFLSAEKAGLSRELEESRSKPVSTGAAHSCGTQDVSPYMSTLRDWVQEREWNGSAKKYLERERGALMAARKDSKVLDVVKTVIRTQLKETQDLVSEMEQEKNALQLTISAKEDSIARWKKSAADAGAQSMDHWKKSAAEAGAEATAAISALEFEEMKHKVGALEEEAHRAAQEKVSMMMLMSAELENLRGQLRLMGRMQRAMKQR